MGIYFDYFRAADDDAAIATHALLGGPSTAEEHGPGSFDCFETKSVFPDPHLELLVALAAGVPYERGPRTSQGLWPPPETPPPVDDTSLWLTDPSVERLATRLRDALAAINPEDAVDLGRRWVPELGDRPADEATDVIIGLSALARRALEADDQLYCWSSL